MILEIALALTLQDIGWLAGDWQLTSAPQCVEEHWTAPSSNLLVGMSRTVAGGRTTSFEFVRIEARRRRHLLRRAAGREAAGRLQARVGIGRRAGVRQPRPRRSSEEGDLPAGGGRQADGADRRRERRPAFSEDYPYRRPSNSAASRCGAVK